MKAFRSTPPISRNTPGLELQPQLAGRCQPKTRCPRTRAPDTGCPHIATPCTGRLPQAVCWQAGHQAGKDSPSDQQAESPVDRQQTTNNRNRGCQSGLAHRESDPFTGDVPACAALKLVYSLSRDCASASRELVNGCWRDSSDSAAAIPRALRIEGGVTVWMSDSACRALCLGIRFTGLRRGTSSLAAHPAPSAPRRLSSPVGLGRSAYARNWHTSHTEHP